MRAKGGVEGILAELHHMGITISVNNFDTDYSVLSYLKNFLIDYLKIDRHFISGIPSNPNNVTIAKTTITMAKQLNVRIIAGGIETG
jgi:EAL domain-containing protein (putative c-di-GMP-specific phosphodiesterase class I)